ncbi:MAG TPA: hypothetical protein VGB81_14830 [Devosia sp.]|jgi:hypothetical protein
MVLVRLRLSRLLLSGLCGPFPATATAPGSHILAAIHTAIAIAVGTAAAAHCVALMLVVLAARLLALGHLVPCVAGMPGVSRARRLLVLGVALMGRCGGRRLRGGRHGERKRNRADEYLHFKLLSHSRTKGS